MIAVRSMNVSGNCKLVLSRSARRRPVVALEPLIISNLEHPVSNRHPRRLEITVNPCAPTTSLFLIDTKSGVTPSFHLRTSKLPRSFHRAMLRCVRGGNWHEGKADGSCVGAVLGDGGRGSDAGVGRMGAEEQKG